MSDPKERKSILLDEAKKIRELVDRVIARLESAEPDPGLRSEIDELKEKVIELLQGMEEVRMEDIMEKVKQHTADARKKFQDVLGNIGPSLDELSRKAHGIFGDWFGKDTISRDGLKAAIMSEDLASEYYETMRRRNWSDQGIQESLDVLRQILLSRI
jgi:hypothetical protein